MSVARSRQVESVLRDELRGLARALGDVKVFKDTGPIQSAASNLHISRSGNRRFFWEYEISQLEIGPVDLYANEYRHSRPKSLDTLSLEININVKGECFADGECYDPFSELQFDLEMKGKSKDGGILTSAMHLDRQPDLKPDGSDTPLFTHPGYHFHFGGKKMWGKDDAEFGTTLLLESPRLAHPPLDGILGIDFVLANYVPTDWRKLRSSSGIYRDIVSAAQRRYWRPYAMASLAQWDNVINPTQWQASIVWPNLFK